MNEKCFCHLTVGSDTYEVKDAKARENIGEIQNSLEELQNRMSVPNNKTIVIGDSYLAGQNANGDGSFSNDNWGTYLKGLMGLSDVDYYCAYEGGTGFSNVGVNGNTFLGLLQSINIEDKSIIKNIIVCGGCNDTPYTGADLKTSINEFVTYCKNNFVNAGVYVGMIGGFKSPTNIDNREKLKHRLTNAYKSCIEYGAYYLNGIEVAMQNYKDNYSNDSVHPNTTGQKAIAYGINQCLKMGYVNYNYGLVALQLPTVENKVSANNIYFNQRMINNKIYVNVNGELTLVNNITSGEILSINFGVTDLAYLRRTDTNMYIKNITVRLTDSEYSNFIVVPAQIYLNSTGELTLQVFAPTHSLTNLNKVIISNSSFDVEPITY